MSRPPRAEHVGELLDAAVHDPLELDVTLRQIAAVNRWLGGRRALLRHLLQLLPRARPARILDVGTGSADLPRAIADWARRRRRPVQIVATDLHPQMLEIARRSSAAYPEITVERADALELPYPDDSYDVALLSLALHHLEGGQQIRALQELRRVARSGLLVGELERDWPNYLGARFLGATLWRRNRLVRHDAPLSVLRAFTPAELLDLARRAGLPHPRVHRHFFHRLVLVDAESRRQREIRRT
ncbi:MAG: methyltransferase domain-containing protein [Gemmatimonadetes bacterium]|nr:methyltransferase domain-containing protein [Gemmatimonadota bacterium]